MDVLLALIQVSSFHLSSYNTHVVDIYDMIINMHGFCETWPYQTSKFMINWLDQRNLNVPAFPYCCTPLKISNAGLTGDFSFVFA